MSIFPLSVPGTMLPGCVLVAGSVNEGLVPADGARPLSVWKSWLYGW